MNLRALILILIFTFSCRSDEDWDFEYWDIADTCQRTCTLKCRSGFTLVKAQDYSKCFTTCRCDRCPDSRSTCSCKSNEKKIMYKLNGCETCRCEKCLKAVCVPPCRPGEREKFRTVDGCRECSCTGTRCDSTCAVTSCPRGGVPVHTKDSNGCTLLCGCYCPLANCDSCPSERLEYYLPSDGHCTMCRCRRSECPRTCNETCTEGVSYLEKKFDEINKCYLTCQCKSCPVVQPPCVQQDTKCPAGQVMVEIQNPDTNCKECRCSGTNNINRLFDATNEEEAFCRDVNCNTKCANGDFATSVVSGLCNVCRCETTENSDSEL